MNTYIVLMAVVVAYTEALTCPSGFVYYATSNSCYKLLTSLLTWDQAHQACKTENPKAHLVVIDNDKEYAYVKGMIGLFGVWTAGRGVNKAFQWWPNGNPTGAKFMSYTNWALLNPTRWYECVHMFTDGMKDSFICASLFNPMCEVELPGRAPDPAPKPIIAPKLPILRG